MRIKHLIIVISIFLVSSQSMICQEKITWDHLAKVTFTEKYFPAWDTYFLYPHYKESVKQLEGKKITISGYFLDVDPEGKLFLISKNPMASCFFCGGAGPETAMEVQFKKMQKFKTDDVVTFTGILKLNPDDPEHFNYILTEAVGRFK
ncbi:hypothetical protein [Aquimarina aquimarini]|uniref:hypothetical protein n=1 Tax=Aquimarina aquimarini TaxID=1191734 RepID=UPI000D54BDA7|nr:hypothetical protein [Aquimarina aquimarini]